MPGASLPRPMAVYSGPKGDLVWKEEDCFDCSGCVGICPFDALELRQGLIIADMERCTLCTLCDRVCPTAAIDIVRASKNGR